jgi:hypothetical protein
VTDDRLHQQARYRSGDPEYWNIVDISAKCLKDTAHVTVLQGKAKLDAQKTEAHIPDLPERERWFPPVDHIHSLLAVSFITRIT